ncbi:segregation/condensation protein A [Streptomyces xantholiticus]
MPPNDDPPSPTRRRALGRGPGAARPAGGVSPTPPLPDTGGEPPDPEEADAGSVGGEPPAVAVAARGEDPPTPPLPEAGGQSSAPDAAVPRGGEGRPAAEVGVFGVAGGGAAPDDAVVPRGAGGSASAVDVAAGGEPPAPDAAVPRGGEGRPAAEVDASGVAGGESAGPGAAAPRGGAGGEPQTPDAGSGGTGFRVKLVNFEGPFDLLLQLISKHKLDVTEVALSKVTDEFMAYIRAMGPDWDLDQTTEFLVVAATLLDLKAARLLPAAEVEDEADLALLEARDLLFARLLQYRAYKQIADIFDRRLDDEARRFPRTVGLEAHLAELLPDVVISIGAEGFAKLAVKAMQPRPKPQVYVDHIHAPLVSVREQAQVVVAMLKARGRASFRELTEGVEDTLTVVARFLALLELYREKAVALDQEDALGELTVVWAAEGAQAVTVTDEFDQVVEEKQ